MNVQDTSASVPSPSIPRTRKTDGEIIPKLTYFTRPLVTLDPEALPEVSKELALDPVAARAKIPWLKACNALSATQNAVLYKKQLEDRLLKENQALEEKIGKLKADLIPIEAELLSTEPLLAEKAVPLGFAQGCTDLSLENCDLASLEELSGLHHLPPPHEKISWWERCGYKLLAGLGGGAVFGVSLGLLTGKLELVSLQQEWKLLIFWCLIGAIVMNLVGGSLYPLSLKVGKELYVHGKRLPWLRSLQLICLVLLLVALVAVLITVESKIEGFGLFKAISEQTSLTGFRLPKGELTWVSLMLVVPTVSSYVVLGFCEGQRLANLAELKSLRSKAKTALRSDPRFADAARFAQKVQLVKEKKDALILEIGRLVSLQRSDFTTEEKHRLEDMEMDAAGASWEAEDALADFRFHPVSSAPRHEYGFVRRLAQRIVQKLNKWGTRYG